MMAKDALLQVTSGRDDEFGAAFPDVKSVHRWLAGFMIGAADSRCRERGPTCS
jgi:hypothetical protein